jgi:hypothetical protein
MNQSSNETGPSSLVSSTETPTGVAVKELVEPKVVFPVLIIVEAIISCVDAAPSVVIAGKEMLQSMLEFFRDLTQMHFDATASRAFNLEIGSVEEIESLERLNQQKVDAEPDRSSPVAVAAKQSSVRVSRNVANFELLTLDFHGVGILFVEFG